MEDFSNDHLLGREDEPFMVSVSSDGTKLSPLGLMADVIKMMNGCRDKYIETKDKKYWWQMIQLLPSSYNQTRNVMMNYEVLANIYKSRRNHKLDEWRDFCKWIESLPYSELICGEVDIMTPNEQREKLEEVADKFCEIGNINPLSKEEIEQSVNLFRIKEN